MNGFTQMMRGLGAVRLGVMAGVGAGLIGLFIYLSTRLASPDMALLYGDLELNDSSQLVAKLEAMGVGYEIRGNGRQILVPRDQVLRLRLAAAEEGLPSGGTIGYEIFDRSASFGTTNFVQKINHLRALEGELARTIRSLDRVAAARVHLVLPQRELFSRDERQPSASIVLKLQGGSPLGGAQVQSILHLVAAAVPNLNPRRISVVDDRGNLLARGQEDGAADEQMTSSLHELRRAHESHLRSAIESLLEKSVGHGNVRAEVTVEMDLDRVTTNAEIYDPDGQVARSTLLVEEQSISAESETDQPVGVSSNLPEAASDQAGATSRTSNNRTEETINYEISRTIKTQIHESGAVQRLSVAVLVDGTYTSGDDGSETYSPRGDQELAQLAKLVRLAIGYDEERGDKVEVINMRFARADIARLAEAETGLLGLTNGDYFKIAEILVLGIVAVLVLLLVVRPMVARAMTLAPAGANSGLGAGAAQLPGGAQAAIAGPDAGADPALDPLLPDAAADNLIDLERVEGQVRASSIKKVSELVDKHPEETIAIMRQWMYQDA